MEPVKLGSKNPVNDWVKKMKLNLVKKQSAVLLFGILLSSFITEPSFASASDSKYEDSWQKVSGSLTADDTAEERSPYDVNWRLVDNYELFDAVDKGPVSIYIKGHQTRPDNLLLNYNILKLIINY